MNDPSLNLAISEEIQLLAHNPGWNEQFVAERERLLRLLPKCFLAIEHIGSTAVPNLAAKPIIDILGGVRSLAEADALLEPLVAEGYATSRAFNATLSDRRWLMRHSEGRRTHHLHLVVFEGASWERHVQFRDLLRGDPVLAERYQTCKQELAVKHRRDREAYTLAKSAFIEDVISEN